MEIPDKMNDESQGPEFLPLDLTRIGQHTLVDLDLVDGAIIIRAEILHVCPRDILADG